MHYRKKNWRRQRRNEVTQASVQAGIDKTDFAKHVSAEGTKEYFRHFGGVNEVVQKILRELKES